MTSMSPNNCAVATGSDISVSMYQQDVSASPCRSPAWHASTYRMPHACLLQEHFHRAGVILASHTSRTAQLEVMLPLKLPDCRQQVQPSRSVCSDESSEFRVLVGIPIRGPAIGLMQFLVPLCRVIYNSIAFDLTSQHNAQGVLSPNEQKYVYPQRYTIRALDHQAISSCSTELGPITCATAHDRNSRHMQEYTACRSTANPCTCKHAHHLLWGHVM